MAFVRPVRIIDIARNLKLSTTTIIEFLERNSYPVHRSHHTVLLPEILEEIASEFGSGRNMVVLNQLIEESSKWVDENSDTAQEIIDNYHRKRDRMRVKRERSRKVIEGREKAHLKRERLAAQKKEFTSVMQSLTEMSNKKNGKIKTEAIDLEIIRCALALLPKRKTTFLEYLRRITELYNISL